MKTLLDRMNAEHNFLWDLKQGVAALRDSEDDLIEQSCELGSLLQRAHEVQDICEADMHLRFAGRALAEENLSLYVTHLNNAEAEAVKTCEAVYTALRALRNLRK